MEDACHELDVSVALHFTPGLAGPSFVQYADALQQQSTLRDEIDTVKGQIACLEQIFTLTVVTLPPGAPQTNTLLQQMTNEMNTKRKEVEEKVYTTLSPGSFGVVTWEEPEDKAGWADNTIHTIISTLYKTYNNRSPGSLS